MDFTDFQQTTDFTDYTEKFNAQAQKFHGLAGARKNLLINLLFNLLRIYSLPPWRNMIFLKTADYALIKETAKTICVDMYITPIIFANFAQQ